MHEDISIYRDVFPGLCRPRRQVPEDKLVYPHIMQDFDEMPTPTRVEIADCGIRLGAKPSAE